MKKQKGITLIALIITIIVMLILVGVTVNIAMTGGLIGKTKEARFKTEVAEIKNLVEIEKAKVLIDNDGMKSAQYDTELLTSAISAELRAKYPTIVVGPNGELYYTGTSEEEKQWCTEMGINLGDPPTPESCGIMAYKTQYGPNLKIALDVYTEEEATAIVSQALLGTTIDNLKTFDITIFNYLTDAEYELTDDGYSQIIRDFGMPDMTPQEFFETLMNNNDVSRFLLDVQDTFKCIKYNNIEEMAAELYSDAIIRTLKINGNVITNNADWQGATVMYTVDTAGTYNIEVELLNGIKRKYNNKC